MDGGGFTVTCRALVERAARLFAALPAVVQFSPFRFCLHLAYAPSQVPKKHLQLRLYRIHEDPIAIEIFAKPSMDPCLNKPLFEKID